MLHHLQPASFVLRSHSFWLIQVASARNYLASLPLATPHMRLYVRRDRTLLEGSYLFSTYSPVSEAERLRKQSHCQIEFRAHSSQKQSEQRISFSSSSPSSSSYLLQSAPRSRLQFRLRLTLAPALLFRWWQVPSSRAALSCTKMLCIGRTGCLSPDISTSHTWSVLEPAQEWPHPAPGPSWR